MSDVSENFWYKGPELKDKENYNIFLEKNKGRELREEGGRIYVRKERPSVDEVLLKNGFEVQKMIK